jgi:two-component system chemotaxis response regulator CheB
LQEIVSGLPHDLAAAIFIVVHIGENPSILGEILSRSGTLTVARTENGEAIEYGRIYIAPPDRHLLLHDGHVLLRRGPHENLSRPAVDPLFRTAACTFGSRVVGVILSGGLRDGTAGMIAIKACGGITVVQDPADAATPGMPLSVLANSKVDHSVPASHMAELLVQLVREPAGATPPIPLRLRVEAAVAVQETSAINDMNRVGAPLHFICPQCGGTLWEIVESSSLRYRCHVGHAFAAEAVLDAQAEEIETTLWRLVRLHDEQRDFALRLAAHQRGLQHQALAGAFEQRGRQYAENAALVRRLLQHSCVEAPDAMIARESNAKKQQKATGG